MTLDQFNRICDLPSLTEVDKVCYLAFFHLKTLSTAEFTAADGALWLTGCGCAAPNQSRLERNLRTSRNTVKGQRGWRLTLEFVRSLESTFSALSETSQDVVDDGTILPPIDYTSTRGYIEILAKQINASYEHNLFDACAVLMRRLVEILLVLSYRHHQIERAIQDNVGNYQMLEGIINNAKANSTLALSRNSKNSLETFRELGNFSAHKIEYICRREYIRPHIQEYRALVVELLHKSAIRT